MSIPNTTYRVLVEKLGDSNASQFIGNEGEVFYDPNAPILKLSDGTTLGGISISENYWIYTSSGIHTLSNIGIGTTNPRFLLEVGSIGTSGTSLYVNGNARVVGILTVGNSSITLNGNTDTITATDFIGSGTSLTGVVKSSISGIVGAATISNCISISQADYDAIPVKDSNTLYIIV
jgi:hypothetical protein